MSWLLQAEVAEAREQRLRETGYTTILLFAGFGKGNLGLRYFGSRPRVVQQAETPRVNVNLVSIFSVLLSVCVCLSAVPVIPEQLPPARQDLQHSPDPLAAGLITHYYPP